MHEEIQQIIKTRINFESTVSSMVHDYRNDVQAYLSDKVVGKRVWFEDMYPEGIITRIVTMGTNTIYGEIQYSGNRLYQTDIKYVTFL